MKFDDESVDRVTPRIEIEGMPEALQRLLGCLLREEAGLGVLGRCEQGAGSLEGVLSLAQPSVCLALAFLDAHRGDEPLAVSRAGKGVRNARRTRLEYR